MGMNPTFFKTVGTSAALLLFLGAGCGVPPANTPTSQQQVSAATRVFEDSMLGVSFSYPSSWGTVQLKDATAPGFDTGTRKRVTFTNNQGIRVVFFTSDYTEGVAEGAPEFFSVKGGFTEGMPATNLQQRLEPNMNILSARLHEDGWYRLVSNATYTRTQLRLTYIHPQFSNSLYTRVMVIADVGELVDAPHTLQSADHLLSTDAAQLTEEEILDLITSMRAK